MISPICSFTEAYRNRHQLARKWKEEGKKVFGYIYSTTPEELIYAAGIIPVQITENENTEMASKGEGFFPEFFCDYVHSAMGQLVSGVYDYLEGMVIPDNCNHVRHLGAIWPMESKASFFFFLSPPCESKPCSREFFREELRHFRKAIEDFWGEKITGKALQRAIKTYNENRKLLNQLFELRQQESPPLLGSEVFEVVKTGLVIPKEEHNAMLRDLLTRIAGKEGRSKGKVRVMVSSVTFEECTAEEANFVRLIEEAGGNVVCDDLTIGHRYYREPVKLKPDLMEALVDRYLGKVPVAFRMSPEERVGLLLNEALRYEAKGTIVFIPKYCQVCEFHYLYLDEKFKEKGIPTLLLETTADTPPAPIKNRIQAFLEMLG